MADNALRSQWAVCGIAAAATRFVPVPLLDDVLRQRAEQLAVLCTLRAHGRAADLDLLAPLWTQGSRGWTGLGRRLRRASTRLLLFPVRKYTALFGAVKGVPEDVVQVVLLGRTVDRMLDQGRLTGATATDDARALRRAVDDALAGTDLRLVRAAVADALSGTRGLSAAAAALARTRLSGGDRTAHNAPDTDADAAPDTDAAPAVTEGAQRLTEAMRRPQLASVLARFDARIDRDLAAAT